MSTTSPRNLACFGLLALSLSACAGSRDQERQDIAEIGAIHDRLQAEFLAGQEQFRARYPMPVRREVPGVGTLVVHEAALGGRLGQETLHVLFTWVNTTGRTTNGAQVRVALHGEEGRGDREQRVELRSLLGAGFIPDCTYTSFVDLPTEGIHLQPGWDWRIELEPLVPNLWPADSQPAAR